MLVVDPRRGSGEFAKLFSSFSIETITEYLTFADFAFAGNGPDGIDYSIGIERKALSDWLSCMHDERYIGYQLDGMLKEYHFSILIIEGVYRPDRDGYIEELVPVWDRQRNCPSTEIFRWKRIYTGKKLVLFSAFAGHIDTLRFKAGTPNAGFLIAQTSSKLHTTYEVACLYRWFQRPYADHRSHIGFHDPAAVLRSKSSLVRRCAMQISGIGYERSATVEAAFPSVMAMALSNEEDWSKLEGIGKKSAARIIHELRGGRNGQ